MCWDFFYRTFSRKNNNCVQALLWDIILHHFFFTAYIICFLIPPVYVWLNSCAALTMEISTIFLNLNFLAKWYGCSDSVIFKFKCGFLISWFLVRVPISFIYYPLYLSTYWSQMQEEWPFDKLIGVILLPLGNGIMQSIWTVQIIQKAYKSLTKKADDVVGVDNFDLVQELDQLVPKGDGNDTKKDEWFIYGLDCWCWMLRIPCFDSVFRIVTRTLLLSWIDCSFSPVVNSVALYGQSCRSFLEWSSCSTPLTSFVVFVESLEQKKTIKLVVRPPHKSLIISQKWVIIDGIFR